MHAGQVHVDVNMARALIAEQFPHWSARPVQGVQTTGTMNAIFRIGEDLAARFPLLTSDPAVARAALVAETEAAREFAQASPIPTPEPVVLGQPGRGYPLPWVIQTWIPGHDATIEDPAHSTAFAQDLAALITALRSVETKERHFDGSGRGGHLTDHDEWLAADTMCHRDLTPPNVLVDGGRLVGILDAGAFGPADPALDLVVAWHLLDEEARHLLRTTLGCSDIQWERGIAWAFQQAMGLVWYYIESNPTMSRWGLRTLDRIVASGVA